MGRSERGEIMPPDQVSRPRTHRIKVQLIADPPHDVALKHHLCAARHQPKQIPPLQRMKPGVKVIGDVSTCHNRNRLRFQVIVQSPRQSKRIPVARHVHMHHLTRCMHPFIGAPCRHKRGHIRLQLHKRPFHSFLHRRHIALSLPSREGRTVIFDFQGISGHGKAVSAEGKAAQSFPATLYTGGHAAYLSDLERKGADVVLTAVTNGITRGVESVTGAVSEAFFEPVIRLGVTGLARSGKTVFITSLVANLLDRGRMPAFSAASSGAISAAYLRPQPNDTIPRFPFEANLEALTGTNPRWPVATATVSELRLSLRVQPQGLLGAVSGPRTVHLDIVDYPGEWLLDLGLMDKTYAQWSEDTLTKLEVRPDTSAYLSMAGEVAADTKLDEPQAEALAQTFTETLHIARKAGFSDCSPGRFLLPGELKGSPALTFAPLPPLDAPKRGSLYREFERRFEAYKSLIVKPFFRDHFSRIDRQIVLVDALGAIHNGPRALADLRQTMRDLLSAFRPGRNSFLSTLLGRKVDRILFAATKADHIHHSQHSQLTAIMEALVTDARRRADFAGAQTAAMSIAALRATVEEERTHHGTELQMVRGTLLETGKQAAFHPGDLPTDPSVLLGPAQAGDPAWLDGDWQAMSFAPAKLSLRAGDGPPHIRLDRAVEFLIGDRLR